MEKEYYIYVLQSETTGKVYIGQTSELAKRIAQHNDPENKLTKYTKRNRGPWHLVHQEVYKSRLEARNRERVLKSGKGRQWLRDVILTASNSQVR